jgi:poly(A) polymerase
MPKFEEHLELHRLDCESSFRNLASYDLVRQKLAATPAEAMRPQPLITGRELISAGYPPGPRFKEILSAVEDGQLEGRLQSKESAIEFVRQQFPR